MQGFNSLQPVLCVCPAIWYLLSCAGCVCSLLQVFSHVAEYLGRDCLDLLLCVDVAAAAVTPAAAAAGSQAVSSGALQQQPPALQLLLAGAAPGPSASAAAGPIGGGSSSSAAGGGGACCYIINDVNLLTVLETVRLLMDYSS
jgi:hypothetical protein